MMHNLLVDLRDERFGEASLARALRDIEAAGFTHGDSDGDDGHLLAWLDDEFGGTWSTEAFVGRSVVVRKGDAIAGFATYDPKGLRFSWLRGMGARADVGIFGPFGVSQTFRNLGIGTQILIAALARLRRCGYARALIPAVGTQKLVEYYAAHAGAYVVESIAKRSLSSQRYRAVVMASGNGSNFQSVLERSRDGRLPLDVVGLVCDSPQAYALERARAAAVPAHVIAWDKTQEKRSAYDARLRAETAVDAPDLLLLLGWMHLLDDAFLSHFHHAINVHPAFLPLEQTADRVVLPDGSTQRAYRGAHAVRDALADGAAWIGATAHRVAATADRGEVLLRKPLRLSDERSADRVYEMLHALEQGVVAGAVMRWVYEQ
ncbi:MAG TPA: GNAT family N-acetyltransferase [Candidatus Baltobacteraceae bacterium]